MRAVLAEGDYGDAFAWWWRFEKNHGTEVSFVADALVHLDD